MIDKFARLLSNKKSIATIFTRNWLQKIVSVVLAVVLWHFVGGEDKIDKNVMIPIEIINLPRDLVISNQFKKEIEVTLSGPRSLIMDLAKRSVSRQVDLSAATPGTMVIENDASHIPVPRNITVQRIQPSSILLSLDKLVQRQFNIVAETVGRTPDGYQLDGVTVNPDKISITGPLTALSQFSQLSTRVINLDGMKESIQLQVPLQLEPAIVELIGETSVTVDLSIGLKTVTKILDNIPVVVTVDGEKQKVDPAAVKVILKIPKILIDQKVDPKSLFMVTALKREGEEGLEVTILPKPDLHLPLEVVSIIPSVVELSSGNKETSVNKSTGGKPDKPQHGGLVQPVNDAGDAAGPAPAKDQKIETRQNQAAVQQQRKSDKTKK